MDTLKIIVASLNPNKIQGTKLAFKTLFNLNHTTLKVTAEKPNIDFTDKPIEWKELFKGAKLRVTTLYNKYPRNYDFYIGLEGGVVFINKIPHVITIACVYKTPQNYAFGSSILFPLPQEMYQPLKQGIELAKIIEKYTKIKNIRSKRGISSILFKGKYTRTKVNKHAAMGGLVRFI